MFDSIARKGFLAAFLTVLLLSTASVVADSSQAASEPEISEYGYVEDGNSLFYMLKFAVEGIDMAGKTASKVTPDSEKEFIKAQSVYAYVNGLDSSKTYYLMIQELNASGTSIAKTVVKIEGVFSAAVWMSLSDSKLFVKEKETAASASEGTFSSAPGNQTYKFVLKTSSDTSETGQIATQNSGTIATNSKILGLDRIDYYNAEDEHNEMVGAGVKYGFGGSSAAYAGDKLTGYDLGTYVGVFFITNDPTLSIKLGSGNSTYVVPAESIVYTTDHSAGYAYAIISSDVLQGWNMNNFTATLYKGDTVYDTDSYVNETPSGGNQTYIAVVIIVAVVLVGVVIFWMRRN